MTIPMGLRFLRCSPVRVLQIPAAISIWTGLLSFGQHTLSSRDFVEESIPRFEAGLEFAQVHTPCTGHSGCQFPQFAMGAGGSLNLNQHFAIDADFKVTPKSSDAADNFQGGHQVQFLGGLRGEIRTRKYGYFLKLQPGFVTWTAAISGMGVPFQFTHAPRTTRATAVSGGLEYSPTAHVHMRFNATDMIMATGSCCGTNTFQSSVSVYGAFGPPVRWERTPHDPKQAHRFLDRRNVLLLSGSVLAFTADAITTQRVISRGGSEANPLAAPLVNQGWGGQVAGGVIEISGETLIMYGLHRIHHHVLERAVPAALATVHGVYAYQNTLWSPNAR